MLILAVIQGESENADENLEIGKFKLKLPPKPKGENKISVCFEIDGNGILKVSATEMSTGVQEAIDIESQQALTEEDIAGMRQRAAENVAETLELEAQVVAKNKFENLLYEIKNAQKKVTDATDLAVIDELINEGEKFLKDEGAAKAKEINVKIADMEDYFNPIKAKL